MVITTEAFNGVESLKDDELFHTLKTLLEPSALRTVVIVSAMENLDVDDIPTLRPVLHGMFVSTANMAVLNIRGVTLLKMADRPFQQVHLHGQLRRQPIHMDQGRLPREALDRSE